MHSYFDLKQLPESFFEIPALVYKGLAFKPSEKEATVQALWASQSSLQPTVLYTDGRLLRLVGIFPTSGDTAQFGFWETTNNRDLNQEAFALLESEAKQRGYRKIEGPINFNTFHRYRLRLGTPVWQSFDQEPLNPDYYPELLEDLGYHPDLSYESRILTKEKAGPLVYQARAAFLDKLPEVPYDFIPLNPGSWRENEEEIYDLAHHIFSRNPGFQGIKKQEFNLLYNEDFAAKLCPHTSVLFRDQLSKRLVAMSFCMPNYRPLGLEGKANFDTDYPKLKRKTLLAKTQGVHPDFRKKGLMTYLGAYAMRVFLDYYDEVIFCLMREGNFSMRFSEGFPYENTTYALYKKHLVD